MPEAAILTTITERLLDLDSEGVRENVQAALTQGIPPKEIISQGLTRGMEQIGEQFDKSIVFLPELMVSAQIMTSAMEILNPLISKESQEFIGRVILGTAQGDIHYIGKNIVNSVLQSEGYEIHDIGVDVKPELFLEKVIELKADIVGISALVSVAVSKMSETVALLKEMENPPKIIVGGAAVTDSSAEKMGADAYGESAWSALLEVRRLFK